MDPTTKGAPTKVPKPPCSPPVCREPRYDSESEETDVGEPEEEIPGSAIPAAMQRQLPLATRTGTYVGVPQGVYNASSTVQSGFYKAEASRRVFMR